MISLPSYRIILVCKRLSRDNDTFTPSSECVSSHRKQRKVTTVLDELAPSELNPSHVLYCLLAAHICKPMHYTRVVIQLASHKVRALVPYIHKDIRPGTAVASLHMQCLPILAIGHPPKPYASSTTFSTIYTGSQPCGVAVISSLARLAFPPGPESPLSSTNTVPYSLVALLTLLSARSYPVFVGW